MEVSEQLHDCTVLLAEKKKIVPGWVGSREVLDLLENRKTFCLYRESNPGPSNS